MLRYNCGWCLLSRSAPDRLGHGAGRTAETQQRGDSRFHFSDRLVVCRQQAMVELRLETLCGDVRPMLVVLPPDRICRSPPAPVLPHCSLRIGMTCLPVSGPIFAGNFQFSGKWDSGRYTREDHEEIEVYRAADRLHPAGRHIGR
jgi:hypothetical protein